jgi:hypothetical protein
MPSMSLHMLCRGHVGAMAPACSGSSMHENSARYASALPRAAVAAFAQHARCVHAIKLHAHCSSNMALQKT